MTSSKGNIFRVTGLCDGIHWQTANSCRKFTVTGEFPSQRPVIRSYDAFFDLRLNKRLINSRDADDLRRHRAHYDVSVMIIPACDYGMTPCLIGIKSSPVALSWVIFGSDNGLSLVWHHAIIYTNAVILSIRPNILMKTYLKVISLRSRKDIWKCRLQNGDHLVLASIGLKSSPCKDATMCRYWFRIETMLWASFQNWFSTGTFWYVY